MPSCTCEHAHMQLCASTSVTVMWPIKWTWVNIVNPESETGNSYILVATDYFKRWAEAYPIPYQEAATVAKKLTNVMFLWFSPPEQLHNDPMTRVANLSPACWLKCAYSEVKNYSISSTVIWISWMLESHASGDIGNLCRGTSRGLGGVCQQSMHGLQHECTCHYRIHSYIMLGRKARIPVDLMYDTAQPENVSYGEYATKLQESQTKAYKLACESLAEKQDKQNCTTRKSMVSCMRLAC